MEIYNPNKICKYLIARLLKREILQFTILDSVDTAYVFDYNGKNIEYLITDEDYNIVSNTNETLKTAYQKINEIENITKI